MKGGCIVTIHTSFIVTLTGFKCLKLVAGAGRDREFSRKIRPCAAVKLLLSTLGIGFVSYYRISLDGAVNCKYLEVHTQDLTVLALECSVSVSHEWEGFTRQKWMTLRHMSGSRTTELSETASL